MYAVTLDLLICFFTSEKQLKTLTEHVNISIDWRPVCVHAICTRLLPRVVIQFLH